MKKNSSKIKILIMTAILILLLTICALGAVIYTLVNRQPEEPGRPKRAVSAGLVVDNNIDQKAADARFTTDMNMIWTFPSGSAVSNNAIIGNSASNLYDCYFEVYLDDEDQTLLYSSPILPRGKRLDQLKLDQILPDGTYDAVCTYHIIDDEDPDRELGTVSFAVSLMFIKD